MAYIKIAQASISEWGTTHSGQSGNQTRTEGNLDGELNVMEWYNRPWTYVIRPKNPNVADIMAKTAYNVVRNKKVGYNQNNRKSLYYQMKANDWDATKIDYCDTDCSSLWGVCANAAGVYIDPAVYTGTIVKLAQNSGQFEILTDDKYTKSIKYLRKGDALLKPYDHVVICIDETVEKPVIPDPAEKFDKVYITTDNLWLRKGPSTTFAGITVMKAGAQILVCKIGDGWAKVKFGSYLGYCSATYIKEVETTDKEPQELYTTGTVYLREDAGTGKKVLTTIPNNTLVRASGNTKKVVTTTWYEVSYNGFMGYISGKYVKGTPEKINFKATGNVNMREEPSTKSKVVQVIKKDEPVVSDGTYIDAEQVRWYHCTYSNRSGYVSSKYLKEV